MPTSSAETHLMRTQRRSSRVSSLVDETDRSDSLDLHALMMGKVLPVLLYLISAILIVLAVRAIVAPKWKPLVVRRLQAGKDASAPRHDKERDDGAN